MGGEEFRHVRMELSVLIGCLVYVYVNISQNRIRYSNRVSCYVYVNVSQNGIRYSNRVTCIRICKRKSERN